MFTEMLFMPPWSSWNFQGSCLDKQNDKQNGAKSLPTCETQELTFEMGSSWADTA